MAPAPAPQPTLALTNLDRYEVLELISEGGMGQIYKARMRGPHRYERLVAIKTIHSHLGRDERFVRMFLDEVAIASRLTHPNICSVIDFGVTDGTYYYVMEYLRGTSVDRVARAYRRGADSDALLNWPTMVARLMNDFCEGLHAAHELRSPETGELLDVVHRDVSPANLFVCYDGTTRILDFGVASANQRLSKSVAGEVKGKFSYMAPETVEGEPFDRRADIWSLGVVFWELLANKRLFLRETPAATMRAVLAGPIPSLAEVGGVPLELEEIIFKALGRDPRERFATARHMSTEISRWLKQGEAPVTTNDVADTMLALFPNARSVTTTVPRLSAPTPNPTVPARPEAAPGLSRERSSPLRATLVWAAALALLGVVSVAAGLWYQDSVGPVIDARVAKAPRRLKQERTGGVEDRVIEDRVIEGGGRVDNGAPRVSQATSATANDEEASPRSTPSQRRRTQPRSRSQGFGYLAISSRPCWSEVFIDGRRVGPTPVLQRVASGVHSIRLVPLGEGAAHNARVRVEPERTIRHARQVRCTP